MKKSKATETGRPETPDPEDDDPQVWEDYSWFLFRGRRYKKAVKTFEKALQCGSEESNTHRGLAYSLVMTGQIDEAFPHLLKAVEINERNKREDESAQYDRRALGWYYEHKGLHEEAEKEFEQVPPYTGNVSRYKESTKEIDENLTQVSWGCLSLILAPLLIGIALGILGSIIAIHKRKNYRESNYAAKMMARIAPWHNIVATIAGLLFAVFYATICFYTGHFPRWLACVLGIYLLAVCYYSRQILPYPFYKKASPKPPAPPYPDTLVQAATPMRLELLWHSDLRGILSLSIAHWDDSGEERILAVDKKSHVHVLNRHGHEIALVKFPGKIMRVECGKLEGGKRALLGLKDLDRNMIVADADGTKLWSFRKWWGIADAHWGDINGDGIDEMTVGNIFCLCLLDQHGRAIWKHLRFAMPWSMAFIIAQPRKPPMILVSGLISGNKVLSPAGKKISNHYLRKSDITSFRVSMVDGSSLCQIAAIGGGPLDSDSVMKYVTGINLDGSVQWCTPCEPDLHHWRRQTIGCGDLDGDGLREWVFARKTDETVVCTHEGKIIARLKYPIQQPEILSIKNEPGILVTLSYGTISAYVLHP